VTPAASNTRDPPGGPTADGNIGTLTATDPHDLDQGGGGNVAAQAQLRIAAFDLIHVADARRLAC
jgi:hypothetical protein